MPNPALFVLVIVIIALPDPDAIVGGLKETDSPPPAEADNDTFALKPFSPAVVTVLVAVPLRCIDAGDVAERVKSGAGAGAAAAVTVIDTPVAWVTPPPLAVMVKLYVPAAALAGTVKVATVLPAPPLIVDEPNCTVMPPELELDAIRARSEVKPPDPVVVIVDVGAAPCVLLTVADSEEGDALMPKSGLVCVPAPLPPVSAAIKPAFGLPQPVTRSYPATAL